MNFQWISNLQQAFSAEYHSTSYPTFYISNFPWIFYELIIAFYSKFPINFQFSNFSIFNLFSTCNKTHSHSLSFPAGCDKCKDGAEKYFPDWPRKIYLLCMPANTSDKRCRGDTAPLSYFLETNESPFKEFKNSNISGAEKERAKT